MVDKSWWSEFRINSLSVFVETKTFLVTGLSELLHSFILIEDSSIKDLVLYVVILYYNFNGIV